MDLVRPNPFLSASRLPDMASANTSPRGRLPQGGVTALQRTPPAIMGINPQLNQLPEPKPSLLSLAAVQLLSAGGGPAACTALQDAAVNEQLVQHMQARVGWLQVKRHQHSKSCTHACLSIATSVHASHPNAVHSDLAICMEKMRCIIPCLL